MAAKKDQTMNYVLGGLAIAGLAGAGYYFYTSRKDKKEAGTDVSTLPAQQPLPANFVELTGDPFAPPAEKGVSGGMVHVGRVSSGRIHRTL